MEFPRAFRADASSLGSLRGAVAAWASRVEGATPEIVEAAVLAVDEAATNAIVHAYDGGGDGQTVQVSAEASSAWMRFSVADRGAGFRPRRHSPGIGLGFAIIAQLADDLEVRDGDGGGIVVRIGFRLEP